VPLVGVSTIVTYHLIAIAFFMLRNVVDAVIAPELDCSFIAKPAAWSNLPIATANESLLETILGYVAYDALSPIALSKASNELATLSLFVISN